MSHFINTAHRLYCRAESQFDWGIILMTFTTCMTIFNFCMNIPPLHIPRYLHVILTQSSVCGLDLEFRWSIWLWVHPHTSKQLISLFSVRIHRYRSYNNYYELLRRQLLTTTIPITNHYAHKETNFMQPKKNSRREDRGHVDMKMLTIMKRFVALQASAGSNFSSLGVACRVDCPDNFAIGS